jgi:hypothetical protein
MEQNSVCITVSGWRLKRLRKILPIFFKYFYGKFFIPNSKITISMLFVSFLLVVSSRITLILMVACQRRYEIQWIDEGDKGLLTVISPREIQHQE